MHPKKKKLSLFLFIDAFGREVRQRHPEFLKGLIQDSKKLETILGYSSACDPSIISGLTPSEHKLWSPSTTPPWRASGSSMNRPTHPSASTLKTTPGDASCRNRN